MRTIFILMSIMLPLFSFAQLSLGVHTGVQKTSYTHHDSGNEYLLFEDGISQLRNGIFFGYAFNEFVSLRSGISYSKQSFDLYSDFDYSFMDEHIYAGVGARYTSSSVDIPFYAQIYFGDGDLRLFAYAGTDLRKHVKSKLDIQGRFVNETEKPSKLDMSHMAPKDWEVLASYGIGVQKRLDKSQVQV